MNDKIVTHADLDAIKMLEGQNSVTSTEAILALLRRLRAAAEADAPPLPEGWVVLTDDHGARRVLWHWAGSLYIWDDGPEGHRYGYVERAGMERHRLTPLRPTVTEADVEKAAEAALSDLEMLGGHPESGLFQTAKGTIRAAFAAAGIEVV